MNNLTFPDYAYCGVMFFLGQLLHILWAALPSARQKAKTANKPFSYAEWWSCDWSMIAGLNVIGISLLVGLDQIFGIAPEWVDKFKWFFWMFGTFGSTIGFRVYSRYNAGAIKLADFKSNGFDALAGEAVTNVNAAIQKGSDMGVDVTTPPALPKP